VLAGLLPLLARSRSGPRGRQGKGVCVFIINFLPLAELDGEHSASASMQLSAHGGMPGVGTVTAHRVAPRTVL
jgi:hypothetical protein